MAVFENSFIAVMNLGRFVVIGMEFKLDTVAESKEI